MNNTKPLNSPRILIVEDDIGLKTIMERVVRQINPDTRLDWAISAEKAMILIDSNSRPGGPLPYDLVVADIGLPGQASGLDLWERCQMDHPKMTFVFSSGMPTDEFLRNIGDSICPPFLPKPFSPGECRQVLEGLLAYRD